MDNKLNTVSHRFRTNVRFVKDESGTLGSTQMPHLETPHPDQFPELALKYFDKLQPACPKLLKTGWKAWLFPAHRRAIQEANQKRHTVYLRELLNWRHEKDAHERKENLRAIAYLRAQQGVVPAMEQVLKDRLAEIICPSAASASFEISSDGSCLVLDVVPARLEAYVRNHSRCSQPVEERSSNDCSKHMLGQYDASIHSIAVRLIGEAFASAPSIETVVVSGLVYSENQFPGREAERYLFSVRVNRCEWRRVNFAILDAAVPVHLLAEFNLRRDYTEEGNLKSIVPWPIDFAAALS